MLSHRRQSQAQSEAAISISGAPSFDSAPDPAVISRSLNALNIPPGIDGKDSSHVFVDDEASEISFESAKEHTEARMLMVKNFSYTRPDTSVMSSRAILGAHRGI